MGLMLERELENGVTVRYHRIVSVNVVTNNANLIEVASYTSKAKRDEEREAVISGSEHDVFISTVYHNAPYDQCMSVDDAYAWLKANGGYHGADDVYEYQ